MFYRALENDKTDALKQTGWSHDEHMQISDFAKKDLSWWLEFIMPTEPIATLKCDSSLEGWGSVIDNTSTTANGRWSPQESLYRINYLKIKVVLFGLKTLCSNFKHCSIKVFSDNQSAIAYLRNMDGTHSRDCNQITRENTLWCKDLSLIHI